MGESPTDLDALDLGTLKKLLVAALREIETLREDNVQLREQISQLQKENRALRQEMARLKGLKGKPKLKPSGMEKETTKRAGAKAGKKRSDFELSYPLFVVSAADEQAWALNR